MEKHSSVSILTAFFGVLDFPYELALGCALGNVSQSEFLFTLGIIIIIGVYCRRNAHIIAQKYTHKKKQRNKHTNSIR